MDRVITSVKDMHGEGRPGDRFEFESFALPSRAGVLASLRSALEAQAGPALVTGEAGVGKTWLWRRLREESPASRRWADVALAPTDGPADFYRAVGHALGLPGLGAGASTRIELADALADAEVEGRAWVLVLDEAHNLSADVLEEVRLQADRLGHPGGFAGILLAGQTPLSRRLGSRTLAGLDARIAARAHLRPLDIEEARTLLSKVHPAVGPLDDEALERLHRDAAGNPRRLLLLASRRPESPAPAFGRVAPRRLASSAAPAPEAVEPPAPVIAPALPFAAPAPAAGPEPKGEDDWSPPLLGSSRPPLRMEEGLIEVGWDADQANPEFSPAPTARSAMPSGVLQAREVTASPAQAFVPQAPEDIPTAEETIDDPYTAIQARAGREARQAIAVGGDGEEGDASPRATAPPNVWAEGQHEFAPYSNLFSKLRHHREAP